MDTNEKICLCALNTIFGFSPKDGLALLAHIGCASEIFHLGSNDLDKILGPYSKFKHHIGAEALRKAEHELERAEKAGIDFIGWGDTHYPSLLKDCDDAPIGIYIRSKTPVSELWALKRKISIVGTRDITPYGKEWCARIVHALASSGEKPLIISGLALGTDFQAHNAALECGLPTIGVIATGADLVYPYRHEAFAERLCNTPGCALISDYPLGTAPLNIHFLRRNRIIAGMSEATILIESKIKGGGMMTSRLAFSYNREVYALPGRVDDIRSQGCNYLIKSKIAEPITSTEGIIEVLGLHSRRRKAIPLEERLETVYRGRLSKEDLAFTMTLTRLVKQKKGLTLDELAGASNLPYNRVSYFVNMLESDGFVTVDLLQRVFLTFSRS